MPHQYRSDRVVTVSQDELEARSALRAGEYARHLEHKLGLARRFAPLEAFYVDTVAEKVERINIVELRGSGSEWIGPAQYCLTDDNRLLPTRYLFPVAKHKKPRLLQLQDELGSFRDWAAPLMAKCKSHW